jgi:uridine kinase
MNFRLHGSVISEESLIIGISGGTCSGKTSLALALQATLGAGRSCVLSLDSYYVSPNPDLAKRGEYNFDHPGAVDLNLFKKDLASLIRGNSISSPIYDRCQHRIVGSKLVTPAKIIIVEGLFTLWDEDIRNKLNLKIFLDTATDVRLGRRMIRDANEYKMDLQQVFDDYIKVVRPMHFEFTEPTKAYADLVLSWPLSMQEQLEILLKELERF